VTTAVDVADDAAAPLSAGAVSAVIVEGPRMTVD